MKKLLIALAAVIVTVASYAQGTVNFSTRNNTAGVDAPVSLGNATGPGPGPSYKAALYVVSGGNLTLIPASVTTFRDPGTGSALLAKYITPLVVEVPGTTVGGAATLRMRAWTGTAASWEAADPTLRGESIDLAVTGLGGGAVVPADLPPNSVFNGFIIPVPEPSTIALGVLGAAALLLRRRK